MSQLQLEAAIQIVSRSVSLAIWGIAKKGHQSVNSAPRTPTSTSVVMLMHTTVQIVQHRPLHLVALLASKAASSEDLAMKVT